MGTVTNVGNVYTVGGVVDDENGFWNATYVSLGDSVFYLEESTIYPFVISNILGASGSVLNVEITSTTPLLSTSSSGTITGQICISRRTDKGYCPVPVGLNEPLKWAMENRFKQFLSSTDDEGLLTGTMNGGGTEYTISSNTEGSNDIVLKEGAGINLSLGANILSIINSGDTDASDDVTGVVNGESIVFSKTGFNISGEIAQNGATTGQVLKWNGTKWIPDTDNTSMGGLGAPLDATYLVLGSNIALTNERVISFDPISFKIVDNGAGNSYTIQIEVDGITSAMIADGTILEEDLADGSVTNTKIGNGAISTNKVQDYAITVNKLANTTVERHYPTTGTTITLVSTLPTDINKIFVTRNGVKYDIGTTGCTECNVIIVGQVLTFVRPFTSGEEVVVKF